MAAVDAVAPDLGATQACQALGISRATPAPAPAATGPTSVEQPATAAAAGPVRR
jgi:hypothetical protein